jgi:hypothetical protein
MQEDIVSKIQPPVPPENLSDKGPATTDVDQGQQKVSQPDPHQRDVDKQGRQGNIKQNTTNQGYQQDR